MLPLFVRLGHVVGVAPVGGYYSIPMRVARGIFRGVLLGGSLGPVLCLERGKVIVLQGPRYPGGAGDAYVGWGEVCAMGLGDAWTLGLADVGRKLGAEFVH